MDFSLNPGYSLGPIELGSLLWNVVSTLRAEQSRFRHVELCWESEKPATGYILLSITSPSMRLLFEGVSQRLLLIEAHQPALDDSPVGVCPPPGDWVHYQNHPISQAVGSNEPGVTLRVIHRLFGPTYPPAQHVAHQEEMVLSYPGVAFSFRHDVLARVILSVQPTGEFQEHDGNPVQLTEAYFKPKMPQSLSSIDGDVQSAKIKLGRMDYKQSTSITFNFHSSSANREIPNVQVIIGHSTSEDILCEFGAPLRTFWKEDDRMEIHTHLRRSFGRHSGHPEDPNPYFMSYFNIGVDFLIDPITHVVLKVILHSNIPGEVLFTRYSRCPWSICMEDATIAVNTDKATTINQKLKMYLNQKSTDPHPTEANSEESTSLSLEASDGVSDQKAPERLSTALSNMIEPAMLLDRTADVIDDGLILQRPTRLYGHPAIVLEVTQDDYVETVWLF